MERLFRQEAASTWSVRGRPLSRYEVLKKMALKAFGQLFGDSKAPNLKELMEKSFVIKGVKYVEAGDFERLILTVEVNGKGIY
jgi:hypothetical protein